MKQASLDARTKIRDKKIVMARLKNKQRQIPSGLGFYQPETKFKINTGSFQSIVNAVVANRKANPFISQQHGLSTDPNDVSEDVDAFNAAICERMGWTDYIMMPSTSAPAPKFKALSPQSGKDIAAAAGLAKKIWQGVKTLNDWIESGEPAVPTEQSESRAQVCAACPMNGEGGLEKWFTAPASVAIKKQFEKLESRKLSTTVDAKLGVCKACSCPLKLMVHTPLKYKLAHMGEETRKALDHSCWVLSEQAGGV